MVLAHMEWPVCLGRSVWSTVAGVKPGDKWKLKGVLRGV